MLLNHYSVFLLVALTLCTALRIGLILRHRRSVAAHRSAVPEPFAQTIELAAHQRAADYTRARLQVALLQTPVEAALLVLWTLGGGLQSLYEWTASLASPGGSTHALLWIAAFALVNGFVELPFSVWRTFVVEARFGFNRSTPRLFLADLAKEIALGMLLGTPLILAAIALMNSAPAWWFWLWLLWLGFNLLALWLFPSVIAPLFNRFEALDNPELARRIEALLDRCGFPHYALYVMDGSRRSAHGNAYFAGIGRARRIVFFDTLLAKLDEAEVEAVLAHELGHYAHHHIWWRFVALALVSLAALWLLAWAAADPAFYLGLGLAPAQPAAALLLLAMIVPLVGFPRAPMFAALSRSHEYAADRYAARHAVADKLISALVKLYRDNAATLTPDPMYSLFHDTHPPATLRIAQLRTATH